MSLELFFKGSTTPDIIQDFIDIGIPYTMDAVKQNPSPYSNDWFYQTMIMVDLPRGLDKPLILIEGGYQRNLRDNPTCSLIEIDIKRIFHTAEPRVRNSDGSIAKEAVKEDLGTLVNMKLTGPNNNRIRDWIINKFNTFPMEDLQVLQSRKDRYNRPVPRKVRRMPNGTEMIIPDNGSNTNFDNRRLMWQ